MAVISGSVRKQVSGTVLNIGVIGAVVLVGIWAAKKYNIGSNLINAAFATGSTAGQAITSPFAGLFQGINIGTQGIATQLSEAQGALFNQLRVSTDQFNNLIHRDWYNPDGSYSPKNPNYGKSTSSLTGNAPATTTSPSAGPGSPPTTPTYSPPAGNPPPSFTGYLTGVFAGIPPWQQAIIARGDSTQGFGLTPLQQQTANSISSNLGYFRNQGLVR